MKEFLKRIEGLSPKRLALLAVELQSTVERLEGERTEPIAVLGIGCRLPGDVANPDAFWQLLREGRDAVSPVPPSRWSIDDLFDEDPDAPGKVASRWGGFVSDIDRFDAPFFGISRREAVTMDPQQRMLLEVSWEAIEHAGVNPHALAGTATGVFVGLCTSDYHGMLLERGREALDAYAATGGAHSVAAGRIAYVLGLHGPNVAVDTACSSSLVALHLACQSLLANECRTALAGGVNALLAPDVTVALSKAHMMAPDGRCKAFDERADGFVRGEGCGIVMLKRLSHAIADGDRVLAVIRGSAMNQDGRSSGITAPNGTAQEAVMRAALARAGVAASAIDYLETHGTGTSLGDPIEAHALRDVMGEGRTSETPLVVGSVKTNLGHLESAAGITGLIKVVLSLQHEWIPPHLHFRQLNPHIDWKRVTVEIPTHGKAWRRGERRRLAGVSSFGFSGTNVHVILEEAPLRAASPASTVPERPVSVLTLSARSPEALQTLTRHYGNYLATHPEKAIEDICFTANTGRAPLPERAAFVAASREELQAAVAEGRALGRGRVERTGSVAFLFTGQGAQYAGMGRQLYETEPVFRAAIDECAELLKQQLDTPLLSLLWGDATTRLESDTAYTQPALFALQWALAQLWRSWGVQPAVVLGHSVGEYAAACVAGVFSLADGLRLIATRGRLTGGLPAGAGAMAAILAPRALVEGMVSRAGADVGIAAVNGPEHVVVAGSVDRVAAIEAEAAGLGHRVERLRVSHAFHSPLMAPIESAFEAEAARVPMSPPSVTLISTVAGRVATIEDLGSPSYWRRQVRDGVLFESATRALAEQGCDAFVEIGPGSTLLGLANPLIGREDQAWVPCIRRSRPDATQIAESAALLWARGVPVDWHARDLGRSRARVALPTYPFERKRYWLDAMSSRPSHARSHARGLPVLGARTDAAVPIYEGVVDVESSSRWMADHRVGGAPIVPASVYIETAIAAAMDALKLSSACVRDLDLVSPLRLNDESALRTQTVLHSQGPGRALLQFFSRDGRPGSDPAWVLHASGSVGPVETSIHIDLGSVQRRLQQSVDPALFYEVLLGAGVDMGPECRGIRRLWTAPGEALAEIAAETPLKEAPGCSDPRVLDACLQVPGAAVVFGRAEASHGTYVLARVGAFHRFGAVRGRVFAHARLSEGSTADGITATLDIFDETGKRLATAAELAMKPFVQTAAAPNEWFYTLDWQSAPMEGQTTAHVGLAAADQQLLRRLREESTARSREHGLDAYATFRAELDSVVSAFVVRALTKLGASLTQGAEIDHSVLKTDCVRPEHTRLCDRLFAILEEDRVLRRVGDRFVVLRGTGFEDPLAACARLTAMFPQFGAEIALTERCGAGLADVLRGEEDPLNLLAPGGSFDALERLYTASPGARVFNAAARSAIEAALEQFPSDRPVRVLEIGGGTGGTTTYLLPALASRQVEYVFTDVTPAFTNRAQRCFADTPWMRYAVLDIERPPIEQGFRPGDYDIIVAANVLHATPDLRRAVRHARELLRPGGLLVALEGTRPERWVDVTFGMTDGWWKFDDDLRPTYPLISRETWLTLLKSEHFEAAAYVQPDFDVPQVLLLASADASRVARADRCLVVSEDTDEALPLQRRLSTLGMEVDIAVPQAFAAALGRGPLDHVVLMAGHRKAVHEHTLEILRPLVASTTAARLWVVTRGAQAVGTDRQASPDQAVVWGIGRTIALEHPDRWGGLVDVGREDTGDVAAECIAREILSGSEDDQVAYRAGQRFVARVVRTSLSAGALRTDPAASYLVTGGLGRLGIQVAEYLATSGARHIVLSGRTVLPDRSMWDGVAVDGRLGRALAGIRRLEAKGVTVSIATGDVTSDGGVDVIRLALGDRVLRGVVHTAAVFDSAPLLDLTPERLEAVLQPKAEGCRRILELARRDQLDFVILFSSTTSLLGVREMGAYAAANQYLDSLAWRLRAEGYPAVSINWGTWNEMGDVATQLQQSYVRGGLHPMSTSQALAGMAAAVSSGVAQVVIADIDWAVLKPIYEARRRHPVLELVSGGSRATASTTVQGKAEPLAALLARARDGERVEILVNEIRAEAAAVLALEPDEVNASTGLFEMGMDSLMSVELKRRLEGRCGRPLPSTLTFNYPNVQALAGYLAGQLEVDAQSAAGRPAASEPRKPADIEASQVSSSNWEENEDLSEEELADLLVKALQR